LRYYAAKEICPNRRNSHAIDLSPYFHAVV